MKQKMKKIILSLLLILSFGFLVPRASYAAATAADLAAVQNLAEQNVQAIVGFDDPTLEQYIYQFEAGGLSDVANGLISWKELKKEIGGYVSTESVKVTESGKEFIAGMVINCEQRQANVSITFDSSTGQLKGLTFDKVQTLNEKLKDAAFNLVVGMGTVFLVLIFIAFIISRFIFINRWANEREEIRKEEEAYQRKVAAAKTLPAVMKNASKKVTADAIRAAVVPEGVTVRCIEGPKEEKVEEAAAPAPAGMDPQLIAVLAAAVAAYEGGIDPQLVAVITAAIQAAQGPDEGPDGLIVRSIRRVGRSAR